MVNFKNIRRVKSDYDYDFTQEQIRSLFDSLRKIRKGRSFVFFLLSGLTITLYSMEPLVQIT
jgi:MFS-type transporter involved in bile tolerance (Atg22 family)